MNERLGETRLNKQGTMMKIVRYGSYDDIDIEFIDEFHYLSSCRIPYNVDIHFPRLL